MRSHLDSDLDELDRVQRAIADLTAQRSRLLLAASEHGASLRKIATRLHLPYSTVQSWVARERRQG